MNLQITVPYQTCPFKCPFCIANNPKVMSKFENKTNDSEYWQELHKVLLSGSYTNLVITGDTEPTLNIKWIEKVCETARVANKSINIELQTKNFNSKTIATLLEKSSIDVYGFSVDNIEQFERVEKIQTGAAIKRLTLLLNNLIDLDQINTKTFQQITVKYLQMGENDKINEWISKNQFRKHQTLNNFIERHKHTSLMLDENCMISENRYNIFRENGKVYKNWTEI